MVFSLAVLFSLCAYGSAPPRGDVLTLGQCVLRSSPAQPDWRPLLHLFGSLLGWDGRPLAPCDSLSPLGRCELACWAVHLAGPCDPPQTLLCISLRVCRATAARREENLYVRNRLCGMYCVSEFFLR